MSNLRQTFLLLVAVFVLGASVIVRAHVSANNISLHAVRDCNSHAIISCGSLSSSQLIHDYSSNSYAQTVYAYFGITSSDIKNLPETAAAGYVDKQGRVYLNGRSSPVASGAITAEAQSVAGSKKVRYQGVTFYTLSAAQALTTNSADAYVIMDKGNFDYAVIASGGYPVIVTAAAPSAAPTAPMTPAPAAPVSPPGTAAPSTLTNTGPINSGTVALVVESVVIGTLAARRYQLRSFKKLN